MAGIHMIVQSSEALGDLFFKYTHLSLGGKEIRCPYWMDNNKAGIWGPLGGKGRPEQIIQVTEELAQKKGLNLGQMTQREILSFMKSQRIGVDCSGLAFWLLDALDKEKGGNGIADDIPNCRGKYLDCRASVQMLTDSLVAAPVDCRNVKVGDMLRLKRGKHIAVVMTLTNDELIYAHSSSQLPITGVQEDKTCLSTLVLGPSEGFFRLKIWA